MAHWICAHFNNNHENNTSIESRSVQANHDFAPDRDNFYIFDARFDRTNGLDVWTENTQFKNKLAKIMFCSNSHIWGNTLRPGI